VKLLDDVARMADLELLDHLDRQVTVPVLTDPQAQGDLIVIPVTVGLFDKHATTALPAEGVPVVRGENGGHTHHLIGEGPVCWAGNRDGAQTLGVLTVPADATAYVVHPEHGAAGIGPGTYVLRRQREQADVTRLVAD
jgi:hypothetical protein